MENRQYGCDPWGWRNQQFNHPPANIAETQTGYILKLFAPSLIKENISITTQNDILSIRYRGEKDSSSNRYTRREYRIEEIERSFDLRGKVEVDKINASYADGVLTVDLPKTEVAKKPLQDVSIN